MWQKTNPESCVDWSQIRPTIKIRSSHFDQQPQSSLSCWAKPSRPAMEKTLSPLDTTDNQWVTNMDNHCLDIYTICQEEQSFWKHCKKSSSFQRSKRTQRCQRSWWGDCSWLWAWGIKAIRSWQWEETSTERMMTPEAEERNPLVEIFRHRATQSRICGKFHNVDGKLWWNLACIHEAWTYSYYLQATTYECTS